MFSAYVSSVTQLSLNLRDLARSEPQKSEELAKLGIISLAEGFAKAMFHSRAIGIVTTQNQRIFEGVILLANMDRWYDISPMILGILEHFSPTA